MWLNDQAYFEKDSGLVASAFSIHFGEDFVGEDFLELACAKPLGKLFRNAQRGIKFLGLDFPIEEAIQGLMDDDDDFEKLMKLLQILHHLAKHDEIEYLSSGGYLSTEVNEGSDEIHKYIFNNFNKTIQLQDVAKIAGMNPSAFSRYFKRIHRKTFSNYLIEIRIGYACKLLMENKSSISAICYESGFNNLSNFNKQFRRVKGMNPSEFIRLHR